MAYIPILQVGHWEPFLGFVWQYARQTSGHTTAAEWMQSAKGREESRLLQLIEENSLSLPELVNRYFNELSRPTNEHCLRCNSTFRDTQKSHCGLCGWDYQIAATLQADAFEQVVRLQGALNAQKLQQELLVFKLQQQSSQLDGELYQLLNLYADQEQKEKELSEQIRIKQHDLAEKKVRKHQLESQLAPLEDEIKEMITLAKNIDSIYKSFRPLNHSKTVTLRVENGKLVASARQSVPFPADLIMALKSTALPDDAIVNKATYFLFLKKENWKTISDNRWQFDLNQQVADQVSPGTYYAQFSPLSPAEFNCRVDFVSKPLTFR